MAGVGKNRRVVVPGHSLEVSYVVGGKSTRGSVLAIAHAERIVMIFYDDEDGTPAACSMTIEQAKWFAREVRQTYQAIVDDAKIEQLEREFNDEP